MGYSIDRFDNIDVLVVKFTIAQGNLLLVYLVPANF